MANSHKNLRIAMRGKGKREMWLLEMFQDGLAVDVYDRRDLHASLVASSGGASRFERGAVIEVFGSPLQNIAVDAQAQEEEEEELDQTRAARQTSLPMQGHCYARAGHWIYNAAYKSGCS
jgi:hypothetical protein